MEEAGGLRSCPPRAGRPDLCIEWRPARTSRATHAAGAGRARRDPGRRRDRARRTAAARGAGGPDHRPRRRGVRRAARRVRVGRRRGGARRRRTAVLRQPSARDAATRLRRPQPHRRDHPGRPRLRPVPGPRWTSTPGGSSASSRRSADLPASERVRQLGAALDLWRGPAYAEYADEPWAGTEVARLTELRTVAREGLMDARLALGDAPLLVPELEALVAEDPLREERWRLLVLALYRAHRQGDALAALRRARQTLAVGTRASSRDRRCARWNATCWRSRPRSTGRPGCCPRRRRGTVRRSRRLPRPPNGAAGPVGPGRSRPRAGRPDAGRRRRAGRQSAARC